MDTGKTRTTIIVIVIICFILGFTNPSAEDHKAAVYNEVKKVIKSEDNNIILNFFVDMGTSLSKTLDLLNFRYDDYVLFSTLTYEGNVVSIGLLGKIYVPALNPEKLKQLGKEKVEGLADDIIEEEPKGECVNGNCENDTSLQEQPSNREDNPKKENEITSSYSQPGTKRNFHKEANQDLLFTNPSPIVLPKINYFTYTKKHPATIASSGKLDQSFRQLMGNDFEEFLDNIQVASDVVIDKSGNEIFGEGMAPHSGGAQAGAYFIDKNGHLYSVLVNKSGGQRFRIYGAGSYNQLPSKLREYIAINRQ